MFRVSIPGVGGVHWDFEDRCWGVKFMACWFPGVGILDGAQIL